MRRNQRVRKNFWREFHAINFACLNAFRRVGTCAHASFRLRSHRRICATVTRGHKGVPTLQLQLKFHIRIILAAEIARSRDADGKFHPLGQQFLQAE